MRLQHILRLLHPIQGFVYDTIEIVPRGSGNALKVGIRPRKGSKPICSGCGIRGRAYDKLRERCFDFVPLWGMIVMLVYAMRRVDCPRCGVKVEMVPWASGKSHLTHAYCWFLANWAKSLSWKETAHRFRCSWDTVFQAVSLTVAWGLKHRSLEGIRAIGVDELSYKKGQNYLTMVYQIDDHCRRLLFVTKDRTTASFNKFFDMLGQERSAKIEFVASDMWKAFLNVVKDRCSAATHVLDRFHIMQMMSKAIDQVRREEARELKKKGKLSLLVKSRWVLLKNKCNLTTNQKGRLRELLSHNLKTTRAYLLKEDFQHLWTYTATWAAERFLKQWTGMVMRSRIEPLKSFARTLRRHQPLILNWFRARNCFLAGATEGFNNKARITTRKAYGFRTYKCAEIALYHSLGQLPEPDWITHKFF